MRAGVRVGSPLSLLLLLMLSSGLSHAHAHEPPCPSSNHPMVELTAQVEPSDPALLERIERHLAAALRARGIGVCASAIAATAGIGRIQVEVTRTPEQRVVARIAIADRVTQKRVERALELTDLPADSRALAIASSADELLRASWAELALRDAPALRDEPPAVVRRVVEQSLRRPESARLHELSLEGSAGLWKRLSAFGGKVRLARWLAPHWGLMTALSASLGRARDGSHGSIRPSTLALELGGDYSVWRFDAPYGLAFEAAASLLRISFEAHANSSGEAHSFSDWSALAHARARSWIDLGPVRSTLSVGAAYGLRASRAFDAGHVVSSNQGFGAELLVGCGTRF